MDKDDKYLAEQLVSSLQDLVKDDSAERHILNALYTIIHRQPPGDNSVESGKQTITAAGPTVSPRS